MGNKGSIPDSAIEEAKAKTQLSSKDLQRLRRRFQRLVGTKNGASKEDFVNMPELAGNPYGARLFDMMDTDKDGRLSFLELSIGMNYYLSICTTPEKTFQLILEIHDLDNDGMLSKPELSDLMHMSAGQSYDERQLQEIVDLMMKLHDKDGDGYLNEEEFTEMARACGQIFNS